MQSRILKIEIADYREKIEAIEYIRTQVFQKEQGVAAELEFDGKDNDATHLLAYVENKAIGTLRIRNIDVKNINTSIEYDGTSLPTFSVKIERLAVLSNYRNQGIGTKLMMTALNTIDRKNNCQVIVHAQEYISEMYEKLGFVRVGETFTEANIPHIKMIKNLN